MEEDQESRFVCKLCNKRFKCGKSLGGHMRSHVISNSQPNMKKFPFLNAERNSKTDSRVELQIGGISGYGLRENPKKTWRASDLNFPLPQERVCKQCGKGFQSLKALCGHMASHSERVLKDDHSWTSDNQKQIMDGFSDTEIEDRKQGKDSKRYRRIVVKSSSFSLGNNGSSSVSEIDEQEEVAMCLMMLSKDSGNWGGVNSVVESSDNNSVVLETKSSSIDMRIGRKQGLNSLCNGTENLKMKKFSGGKSKTTVLDDEIAEFESSDSGYFRNGAKKVKSDIGTEKLKMKKLGCGKLKSTVFDAEIAEFENYDSGYFRNGPKKVKSDISVDGFQRNFEYKKPKVSLGSRFEFSGFETEGTKDLVKEKICEYDDDAMGSKSTKNDSRKRIRDPEFWGKKMRRNDSSNMNVHKRSKYECLTCKKTFTSFQGLGGHRPCYKKTNVVDDDITRRRESAGKFDGEEPISKSFNVVKRLRTKKIKSHECPFCGRLFKSGQALGGHKRSHFIGGVEDNSIETPETKLDFPDLLDLNLPAPVEDEEDGHDPFVRW